jgi:hypothetical protein
MLFPQMTHATVIMKILSILQRLHLKNLEKIKNQHSFLKHKNFCNVFDKILFFL